MKVRFQADNDLRRAIVLGALKREPAVDFRSAQAARLDGVSDLDVLKIAADSNRVLISHDFGSMPGHFEVFTRRRLSPGVFLIKQNLPIREAVESLLLVWDASESDEWENRLCLIPSLVTIAIGPPYAR